MPYVEANGVRLYYEDHGSGEPILCIHGTSSSAMVWRDVAIAELSTLGRVIVYDRRGCSRSERPEPYETTSVTDHGRDAAALLRALDASPAIVIGRSYGGEVALDLALREPELVRALVLLEPAASPFDPQAEAWGNDLLERLEAAAALDPDSVAEVFLREVLGDLTWESFKPEVQEMFTANSPAILAEARGGSIEASLEDLARISVPTLLLGGEDSPEPFRRINERIAAAIPASRSVTVRGGHLIDPSDPNVLAFVRSVLATSA